MVVTPLVAAPPHASDTVEALRPAVDESSFFYNFSDGR